MIYLFSRNEFNKFNNTRSRSRFFLLYDIKITLKVRKKAKIDQESMQLSTTPGPGYQWESVKVTIIHHKREPRGQPIKSHFCRKSKTLIMYANLLWTSKSFPKICKPLVVYRFYCMTLFHSQT